LEEHKFDVPSDFVHSVVDPGYLGGSDPASGPSGDDSGGRALRFNEAGEIVNFKGSEAIGDALNNALNNALMH